MLSCSLLFSLWLFEYPKTRQPIDLIGDFESGAGGGNRTLVTSLEDWRSTIELRPRPMRAKSYRPRLPCQSRRFRLR